MVVVSRPTVRDVTPAGDAGEIYDPNVDDTDGDGISDLDEINIYGTNPARKDTDGDKMPDNYLWLGWIATIFPKAKLIYVKRDVRDIAVSCWMTSFRMIRWANDMNHIARRIEDHERIMAHWRQVMPDRFLTAPYEDLVDNPEEASRKLLDWCGLEWDEKVLEFHKHDRPVRTASVSQVRQPIYKSSVQRWKRYEDALGPVLKVVGPSDDSPEEPPEQDPQ